MPHFRANFKRFVPAELTGISWREVELSLPPEILGKAAINEIYIVLSSNCVIELSSNCTHRCVFVSVLRTGTTNF